MTSIARADTIAERFAAPAGARRVSVSTGSFSAWLRSRPLRATGTPVYLFDGRLKSRQDVHAAVVELPLPKRDLQQCADAVMRLYAEYRFARRERVAFHPTPKTELAFDDTDRAAFDRYLLRLFSEAGTASLADELPRSFEPLAAGDLLIQPGHPGHVVIVLDVAEGANGARFVLLGQSYMPAQDFHVLVNPTNSALSPWYDAASVETAGIKTPEWPAFTRKDVRRFSAKQR